MKILKLDIEKIGFYSLGNGLTVCTREKEERGDYMKLAHIDRFRKITWYKKNLSKEVIELIETEARTSNQTISTTQDNPLFYPKYENA